MSDETNADATQPDTVDKSSGWWRRRPPVIIVIAATVVLAVAAFAALSRPSGQDVSADATPSVRSSSLTPSGVANPSTAHSTPPGTAGAGGPSGGPSARSHALDGTAAIPGVNPATVVQSLSTTWGLTFQTLPLAGEGERRTASNVDQASGRVIHVTIVVDLKDQLRGATCFAGAKAPEPLAETSKRFLDDCAKQTTGSSGAAVTAWFDGALKRRIATASETDFRTIGTTVGTLKIEVVYNSVSLDMRIKVPAP